MVRFKGEVLQENPKHDFKIILLELRDNTQGKVNARGAAEGY